MAHGAARNLWPDFNSEIHLLVVQRNQLLARSIARYLSAHYASVFVASSTDDAERRLRSGRGERWHVVCGQLFETEDQDGVNCVSRWRAEFPGILRAVLATGSDSLAPLPTTIDGVFGQPSEPGELLALLRIPPTSASNRELLPASTHKDTMTSTKTKAHDLKTLKERTSTAAAVKTTQAALPKVAQGFTIA